MLKRGGIKFLVYVLLLLVVGIVLVISQGQLGVPGENQQSACGNGICEDAETSRACPQDCRERLCPTNCVEMWDLKDGNCVFNACGSGCGPDGAATFKEEAECLLRLAGPKCSDFSAEQCTSQNNCQVVTTRKGGPKCIDFVKCAENERLCKQIDCSKIGNDKLNCLVYDKCEYKGKCIDKSIPPKPCPGIAPPYCPDGRLVEQPRDSDGCPTTPKCEPLCMDSDGGKEYNVKGYASASEGETLKAEDMCSEDKETFGQLFESYCDNNKIAHEVYTCPNGCRDGACIQVAQITCSSLNSIECAKYDNCQLVSARKGRKRCIDKPVCPVYECAAPPEGCNYESGKDAQGCPTCGKLVCPQKCTSDADCPQIRCIRAPCPQYSCIGGKCVTSTCSNNVCEEGEAGYCPPCRDSTPACGAPCTVGTCPQDCQKSTCTDSDGKNLYVKGTATSSSPGLEKKTATDYCLDDFNVNEAMCDEDGTVFTYAYGCQNGCKDGACIRSPQEQTFRNAEWVCADGSKEVQGGSGSCKTVDTWLKYASESCAKRCNNIFQCGISSFSVNTICSSTGDCCSQQQKEAGFRCMRGCGPPVVQPDKEYDISYSCLSPEQIKNRETYGCPICLSSHTKISTPKGEISVEKLKAGMLVWTVDSNGQRVSQPILRVSASYVPNNHKVTHITFKDGRELWVSPQHPTANGKLVEELRVGDLYDDSIITSAVLEQYQEDKTYDILPAGETGYYWANGILMSSTIKN